MFRRPRGTENEEVSSTGLGDEVVYTDSSLADDTSKNSGLGGGENKHSPLSPLVWAAGVAVPVTTAAAMAAAVAAERGLAMLVVPNLLGVCTRPRFEGLLPAAQGVLYACGAAEPCLAAATES